MEAEEIKKLRDKLGEKRRKKLEKESGEKVRKKRLTQQELADLLEVSRATVIGWEDKSHRPSMIARRQLARLDRK